MIVVIGAVIVLIIVCIILGLIFGKLIEYIVDAGISLVAAEIIGDWITTKFGVDWSVALLLIFFASIQLMKYKFKGKGGKN